MRKVYFLLLLLLSFASTRNVYGQLANEYIYSASTGATLDPMAGATTIVAANVDDQP